LVLETPNKGKLASFLTAELVKKKTYGKKIEDETVKPDQISVYAIHAGTPVYYWIIDSVPQEFELSLKYRYVPQWRYKFENHHASFKATLQENVVDRKEYKTLGSSFYFNGFDFPTAINTTGRHLAEIKKVHGELLAIESIFPPSILNSQDKAYQNYVALKKNVEDESTFQTNYLDVLDFFYKENKTQGKEVEFLALVEDFTKYFSKKASFLPNVAQ